MHSMAGGWTTVDSATSRVALRWGNLGAHRRCSLAGVSQDESPTPNSFPRECKRTQGVSTTDLVGRMLLVTKAHHSSQVSLGARAESPRSQSWEGGIAYPTLAPQWALGQQASVSWGWLRLEGKAPQPPALPCRRCPPSTGSTQTALAR